MTQGPETGGQYPGVLYRNALFAARDNVMPPFSTEAFVGMTGLAGDEPDGKHIAERLAGSGHDFGAMRAVQESVPETFGLIDLTNQYKANEAQEELAQAVGAVLSRQLVREGSECGIANSVARASTREDIITPEARRVLGPDPIMDLLDQLFGGRAGTGNITAHRMPGFIIVQGDLSSLFGLDPRRPSGDEWPPRH